jgi:NAD(P)-dependent dehydrogenase (short-subunit alcohol dehydrogenase family)
VKSSLVCRRVLITGAARGLVGETAVQLARRGALVSLVGPEPDLLEQVLLPGGPATASLYRSIYLLRWHVCGPRSRPVIWWTRVGLLL